MWIAFIVTLVRVHQFYSGRSQYLLFLTIFQLRVSYKPLGSPPAAVNLGVAVLLVRLGLCHVSIHLRSSDARYHHLGHILRLGGSIGSSVSGSTSRDRTRRRESLAVSTTPGKPSDVPAPMDATPARLEREKHTRQLSAGSPSSSHEAALHAHSRRVHTTDFSHLPPSPSTTFIQHILRHAGSATSTTNPPLRPSSSHKDMAQPQGQPLPYSSPSVAHSLLRGTQEGWSGLDDDAHADALRKLDGLSMKTARARASVGRICRRQGHQKSLREGNHESRWCTVDW
jgi:hypothetical protein